MAVLPDLDAIGLKAVGMFEKVDPITSSMRPALARRAEDGALVRRPAAVLAGEQPESRPARRASDALRAVEWSEITARLNAARDLRLLLQNESRGRIEVVAASFGDAAASYFAMIEDNEPAINLDALDSPKGLDGTDSASMIMQHEAASRGGAERATEAHEGDARDEQ